MSGWKVDFLECNTPVVYPLDDLRDHDIGNQECWCCPWWDDHVLIHNSMDGREGYERGRRPS